MKSTNSNLAKNSEWQSFWLAVSFLTRIPMPFRIDYSPRLMTNSSLYFPAVGLLLGGIYALAYWLLAQAFSELTSVLLVMCLHLWLTGAFHEDGLADSADGLGGGYTLEDRLRIMKDSQIGSYGTVALVMALILKAALLVDARSTVIALLIAPCVARLTPLLIMSYLPYIASTDTSKSQSVAAHFSRKRLAVATGYTLVVVLAVGSIIPGLLIASVTATLGVAVLWGACLKSKLGGYTGDTMGASVIFSELVLLCGLAG
ncbi:adenosylcobinamide-GDP ribazoletransferase [Marinobacter sp. BGYM27]|uniref:adenosylcobinamide-GDP ribazoletransferase n=1 Tax=unclassified Marinobacter TaxID=83889 RepID=UPI0021A5ED74|nr:adenosylcobinamide-GDP ribazoletransferase [Marinobacter sp. BGYM27]MDG5499133.1 adenosylcobinamide-GDP ribazoletransferase [Marinobacter sp. BGYM27]